MLRPCRQGTVLVGLRMALWLMKANTYLFFHGGTGVRVIATLNVKETKS